MKSLAKKKPLGTGGAIKLACEKVKQQNIIICNGDTLFKIDLQELINFHKAKNADCTLCLKPMENFDRYGVVELDENGLILSFKEIFCANAPLTINKKVTKKE